MKRRVLPTLVFAAASVLLAGCLNAHQPRVTPEHRQLKSRAAVLVLVDARPRLAGISRQPTQSTHGQADVAGWDARSAIEPYLAQRLGGMGLSVVPFAYEPADYAAIYASSQAYPNPTSLRPRLRALAQAADVDMLVTVYRQLERDYVGASIENLVGYGLVRHEEGDAQAFACVRVEAYDVLSDAVIGFADGCRSGALPPDTWQAAWASEETVAIDGAAADTVSTALTQTLQAAVLTAAQEAGLSH